MEIETIKHEIRIRKEQREITTRQIYAVAKQLKELNAKKRRIESEIMNLAELPMKMSENYTPNTEPLSPNQWRGKCSCGITLTSNDMPFTNQCPYCRAEIPYNGGGSQ